MLDRNSIQQFHSDQRAQAPQLSGTVRVIQYAALGEITIIRFPFAVKKQQEEGDYAASNKPDCIGNDKPNGSCAIPDAGSM
ncbi:MAG: hypothetical protein JXA73_07295 [Acidobacteria bacterium]|nr:hypothetical protein [Acidobacteriota bacterium]